MPRKRTELGSAADEELAARCTRGETAETIFEALGRRVSLSTIQRRLRELKAKAPKKPAPAVESAEVPDEIPETTPIEDLNRWIAKIDRAVTLAELDGNLSAMGSLLAKAATLAALRARVTPMPRPDPNDSPDMQKLAKEGEARFLKLIESVFQ